MVYDQNVKRSLSFSHSFSLSFSRAHGLKALKKEQQDKPKEERDKQEICYGNTWAPSSSSDPIKAAMGENRPTQMKTYTVYVSPLEYTDYK